MRVHCTRTRRYRLPYTLVSIYLNISAPLSPIPLFTSPHSSFIGWLSSPKTHDPLANELAPPTCMPPPRHFPFTTRAGTCCP